MSKASMNLVAAALYCEDCDKSFQKKNAQGLAAQHHNKTGHRITGELVFTYEHPVGALDSVLTETDEPNG